MEEREDSNWEGVGKPGFPVSENTKNRGFLEGACDARNPLASAMYQVKIKDFVSVHGKSKS